jgi:hypothetical protein
MWSASDFEVGSCVRSPRSQLRSGRGLSAAWRGKPTPPCANCVAIDPTIRALCAKRCSLSRQREAADGRACSWERIGSPAAAPRKACAVEPMAMPQVALVPRSAEGGLKCHPSLMDATQRSSRHPSLESSRLSDASRSANHPTFGWRHRSSCARIALTASVRHVASTCPSVRSQS